MVCVAYMKNSMLDFEGSAQTGTLEKGYSAEHRARALNNVYAEQECIDSITSQTGSVCLKAGVLILISLVLFKLGLDVYIQVVMLQASVGCISFSQH